MAIAATCNFSRRTRLSLYHWQRDLLAVGRSLLTPANGGSARVLNAEALRQKAAELLEQARHERDPVKYMAMLELAVEYLARARGLDRENKLN